MAGRQKGFSLIELVVAMTVTLIITGAVFQLVTAGQSAFRKEPSLADRQQNIRAAMDRISQDILRAGYGVPQFAQVFTDSLDGVGVTGASGAKTDELQMFMASECPSLTVCPVTGNAGKSVTTRELLASCYQFPSVVLLSDGQKWETRWSKKPGPGETSSNKCDDAPAGTKGGHVIFAPSSPLNPTSGFGNWSPTYMMVGQVIRYRIAVGADGVHNLERSAAGGTTAPDGTSTWEILGRGVEDLQIEYLNASGWNDTPGGISCAWNCTSPTQADYDTIVRKVRVRLSARATGGGQLAGETTSALGDAVRGQLVTEVAPRMANTTLQLFEKEL